MLKIDDHPRHLSCRLDRLWLLAVRAGQHSVPAATVVPQPPVKPAVRVDDLNGIFKCAPDGFVQPSFAVHAPGLDRGVAGIV